MICCSEVQQVWGHFPLGSGPAGSFKGLSPPFSGLVAFRRAAESALARVYLSTADSTYDFTVRERSI